MRHAVFITALLAALASSLVSASPSLSLAKKATLQAVMQTFIDKSSVDGMYLRLNEKSGEVEPMRPLSAHPIMLEMGDYFVLCAEFRDTNGETLNVDFYLAPKDGSYVVFAQQIENRDLIKRLMSSGAVQRLD